jgi:hypothetical protein
MMGNADLRYTDWEYTRRRDVEAAGNGAIRYVHLRAMGANDMNQWEVWLTGSNTLVDRGIATAAELGVYPDGRWHIEGHGVDPDIVVDNLPNETFNGKDAQLDAAVAYVKKMIAEKPIPVPGPPPYPNKRFPPDTKSK